MALTKKLNFDQETLAILDNHFQVEQVSSSSFIGRLTCGQLERNAYQKVNKALEALGGKWNRSKQGHIFKSNPQEQLFGLLDNGSLAVAKEGWFPTPEPVVAQMLYEVPYTGGWVLEPSAGEGAIADYILGQGVPIHLIECVEKSPQRAGILVSKGYRVNECDFLDCEKGTFDVSGFSRVYMNPPFEEFQDIDHVTHAYGLLLPGGKLVSIMSEGPFFREDEKARLFRSWLESVSGYSIKLPADAFKPSGTGVQARIVVIEKSGQAIETKQLGLFQAV